jgi:hypothetical protein
MASREIPPAESPSGWWRRNPGIGDLLIDLEADDLRPQLEIDLLGGADADGPF